MANITIQNENSFRHALNTGITLFTGAGFSLRAKDKFGRPLPLGKGLRDELGDRFNIPLAENTTLGQITTILNTTQPQALRKFLVDRFSVGELDRRYYALKKLNVSCILTTNIDDLFYHIYSGSDGQYLNDIDFRGPSLVDRLAIDAIWLHGCVRHPFREFTFTSIDVASTIQTDPRRWQMLASIMEKRPTLMIGYSMNDSGFLYTLHPNATGGRRKADMWAVFPPGLEKNQKDYIKVLGIQLIEADIDTFLNFCEDLEQDPELKSTPADAKTSTEILFPKMSVPDPAAVPFRPLADFFMGAPPVWSDIFSHRLHQTEHHGHIRNLLIGERDTLVVGIPACGKTTLMMKLAAEIPFRGHKLITDSISVEQADSILKRLGNERALVFMDQCCDDIDGFTKLVEADNVVVAGFDAEYNVEIVSHLVPKSKVQIISVTEISDFDIQAILGTLPSKIKSNRVMSTMAGGAEPSLFEIIEANILSPTLSKRYIEVMRQLEELDILAFDLLLVNCYVHSCRVPVSLDMLIAYYGDSVDGYQDIYRIRDIIGSLISDTREAVVEDNQDYYSPRSTLVSEAILHQVSRPQFRRMLIQFHDRVKPYRISRYDVFRRKAYDHRTMFRAFDDWKDGMIFYETLFQEDNSPYIRQHGALYLTRKKRFKEAFRWIDDAVNATAGRNFTIRNSHARVLFEANAAGDHDDPITRETLFKSMSILSECYHSDRRKTYHAVVFGEQCLRLLDIYGFLETKELLVRADTWLKEELVTYPWHRAARNVKRRVTQKIEINQ